MSSENGRDFGDFGILAEAENSLASFLSPRIVFLRQQSADQIIQ
jgi:hypothetical protein